MARYDLRSTSRFLRELRALRRSGQVALLERIGRVLHRLEDDPYRPRPGVDIKRLRVTGEGVFRVRVGDYRILYEVERERRIIVVTSLFHRGAGYDL